MLFDPVHTQPPRASNSQEKTVCKKRNRCLSIRRRWGATSSSNIERDGERDRAMKMSDGRTNCGAVIRGKKEGGGEKTKEGQRCQWSKPSCPPISIFLSGFAIPPRDTFCGCPRTPRIRWHKTPPWMGSASLMTSLETLRLLCSQQKPVRFLLPVELSCNLSSVLSLNRDWRRVPLSPQHNNMLLFPCLFLMLNLWIHLWHNQPQLHQINAPQLRL